MITVYPDEVIVKGRPPRLLDLYSPCPRKGCPGTTTINYQGTLAYCRSCLHAWDIYTREPTHLTEDQRRSLLSELRTEELYNDSDCYK